MNYYFCQAHGQYQPTTSDDSCPKCKSSSFKSWVPPISPNNIPIQEEISQIEILQQINNKLDIILEKLNEKKT